MVQITISRYTWACNLVFLRPHEPLKEDEDEDDDDDDEFSLLS